MLTRQGQNGQLIVLLDETAIEEQFVRLLAHIQGNQALPKDLGMLSLAAVATLATERRRLNMRNRFILQAASALEGPPWNRAAALEEQGRMLARLRQPEPGTAAHSLLIASACKPLPASVRSFYRVITDESTGDLSAPRADN